MVEAEHRLGRDLVSLRPGLWLEAGMTRIGLTGVMVAPFGAVTLRFPGEDDRVATRHLEVNARAITVDLGQR